MSQPTAKQDSFFEDVWDNTKYLRRSKLKMIEFPPMTDEEYKEMVQIDPNAYDADAGRERDDE